MKKSIYYIVLVLACLIFSNTANAQAPTSESNTTKHKFNFSEVQIESETPNQYKTLEVRYTNSQATDDESILINNKSFKYFTDKKTAIKYYYLVKKDSQSYEVYYVYSLEAKKPEIFTFRIGQ